MDQPALKQDRPQGNFVMNLNFRRTNKDAPPITGRISTPEDPETEFSFSAFEHVDKNGEIYWIGPVDTNRSMRQALSTPRKDGENFVAIRENSFKVFKELHNGTPNPEYAKLSAEEQAKNDAKPAFWATWTRTPGLPQLRCASWERDPSRYGPWCSGNTQNPLTPEQLAAMGYTRPEQAVAAELEAPEPAKTARRRTGRDEGRAA